VRGCERRVLRGAGSFSCFDVGRGWLGDPRVSGHKDWGATGRGSVDCVATRLGDKRSEVMHGTIGVKRWPRRADGRIEGCHVVRSAHPDTRDVMSGSSSELKRNGTARGARFRGYCICHSAYMRTG